MKNEKFSLKKRLRSFVYAFNGLKVLFREEHNARIHLVVAVCVIAAGSFFSISAVEWLAVTLSIGAVFSAELFNSAIEHLADYVAPEKHDKIKKVKDMAAAAVLVFALSAVIVGCLVFIPKLIEFLVHTLR